MLVMMCHGKGGIDIHIRFSAFVSVRQVARQARLSRPRPGKIAEKILTKTWSIAQSSAVCSLVAVEFVAYSFLWELGFLGKEGGYGTGGH